MQRSVAAILFFISLFITMDGSGNVEVGPNLDQQRIEDLGYRSDDDFRAREATLLSDEKNLIQQLLKRYEDIGIIGRPVTNASALMNVYYGIGLIQVLSLDEKNQILTTNVWCRYIWHDQFLMWEPKLFGGVTTVRVPFNRVWTPDIELYNYADTRLVEHREAMVVVSHDGSILWIPPAIFKSTCSIDITHFPFDMQTCHMKFGSWTHDGFSLDINFYQDRNEVDISDYVKSNEWELVEHPARKNIERYACCPEPYPDLTFTIVLRRVSHFYSYMLVLPCVLLSLLTLVIFWLPPESPAKLLLGMNIFVAFFVLLLLLAESTPPAAVSIPLIGKYFCMNMILITLSSFLAIIVINTHIRGDRKNKVPGWLRTIAITYLARALCMTEFLDDPPPASTSTSFSNRTTKVNNRHDKTDKQDKISNRQEKIGNRLRRHTVAEDRTSVTTKKGGRTRSRHGSSTSLGGDKCATRVHQSSDGEVAVMLYHQPPNGGQEIGSRFESRSGSLSGSVSLADEQSIMLEYKPYQNESLSAPSTASSSMVRRKLQIQTPCGLETNFTNCLYQQHPLLLQHQRCNQENQSQSPLLSEQADYSICPPVLDYRDQLPSGNDRYSNASQSRPAHGVEIHNSAAAGEQVMTQPLMNGRIVSVHANKSLQNDLKDIKRMIKSYISRLHDKDRNAKIAKEWRVVARVIDRLFFIFYVCTIMFSLAAIFPTG